MTIDEPTPEPSNQAVPLWAWIALTISAVLCGLSFAAFLAVEYHPYAVAREELKVWVEARNQAAKRQSELITQLSQRRSDQRIANVLAEQSLKFQLQELARAKVAREKADQVLVKVRAAEAAGLAKNKADAESLAQFADECKQTFPQRVQALIEAESADWTPERYEAAYLKISKLAAQFSAPKNVKE